MNSPVKPQILADLKQSREALLEVLADISPQQYIHKDSEGKWSVAEIVEHLIKVESAILGTIKRLIAKEKKRVPEMVQTYEEVMGKATNPEAKAQSPEQLIPSGSMLDKERAIQAFVKAREETESFVAATNFDLSTISFPHPRLGVFTGENWLTFIAGHCLRHVGQIRALK